MDKELELLFVESPIFLEAPWRTRMLGGVGAAVSNGGGYPISSVFSVWG
jgi:hypothetical protein